MRACVITAVAQRNGCGLATSWWHTARDEAWFVVVSGLGSWAGRRGASRSREGRMRARRAERPEDEADHLMALYGGDGPRIMGLLQDQLNSVANRAQVLLQLAGLTITVTGFAARTSRAPGGSRRCSSSPGSSVCSAGRRSRWEGSFGFGG